MTHAEHFGRLFARLRDSPVRVDFGSFGGSGDGGMAHGGGSKVNMQAAMSMIPKFVQMPQTLQVQAPQVGNTPIQRPIPLNAGLAQDLLSFLQA